MYFPKHWRTLGYALPAGVEDTESSILFRLPRLLLVVQVGHIRFLGACRDIYDLSFFSMNVSYSDARNPISIVPLCLSPWFPYVWTRSTFPPSSCRSSFLRFLGLPTLTILYIVKGLYRSEVHLKTTFLSWAWFFLYLQVFFVSFFLSLVMLLTICLWLCLFLWFCCCWGCLVFLNDQDFQDDQFHCCAWLFSFF